MDINFNTGPVRHELLQVADAVAREKSIDRDAVLEAMEQAIQTAGRRKYGQDHDIRATIDRKAGEIRLYRYTQVVDEVVAGLRKQRGIMYHGDSGRSACKRGRAL